jgi:hypothetical protein
MREFRIGDEVMFNGDVVLRDDYRIEYRIISIFEHDGLPNITIEPINNEDFATITVFPRYLKFSKGQLRDNRLKELLEPMQPIDPSKSKPVIINYDGI